jgi:hypothetical protein
MSLIIRSRMWLFPGVLGDLKVRKRSELDSSRRLEVMMEDHVPPPPYSIHGDAPSEDDHDHRFTMLHFLKRCHFPELR